jgi:hypothetical protein
MLSTNFQLFLDNKTREFNDRWTRDQRRKEKERQEQEMFNSSEWEGALDQVRAFHGLNFKEISFTYDRSFNPDRKTEAFCVMHIDDLGSLNLHLKNTRNGWVIESAVGEMRMEGFTDPQAKVFDVQEAMVRMHLAKKVKQHAKV